MIYCLVQLASLTMVAVSNVRWQGSKIRQCRLESRDTICESMGECTQAHNSSPYLSNQTRPTSHVQYDIKNSTSLSHFIVCFSTISNKCEFGRQP